MSYKKQKEKLNKLNRWVAEHFKISTEDDKCNSASLLLLVISREKKTDITSVFKEYLDFNSSLDEIVKDLVQKQLDVLNKITRKKICIGFWMHNFSRSQQISAIRECIVESSPYIGLWFSQQGLRIFEGINEFWHIPKGFEHKIEFVKILFAIDSPLPQEIPYHIKKVAVAHAMHETNLCTKARQRAEECSWYCDYYFSPIKVTEAENSEPVYFPKESINHSNKDFTIISSGYASFDKLFNLCKKTPFNQKKYIVFHIPNSSFIDTNPREIDSLLDILCEKYNDYKILFRPSFEQMDLPKSNKRKNFVYDLSTSYHENYSKARAFITTACYPSATYRTFSMAAEIPAILHQFNSTRNKSHDVPVIYTNSEIEIKAAIDLVLSNPNLHKTELIETRFKSIANVGKSHRMLPIYISAILQNKAIEDSVRIPIKRLPTDMDMELQYCISISKFTSINSQINFGKRVNFLFRNSVYFNILFFIINAKYFYHRIFIKQSNRKLNSFVYNCLKPLLLATSNFEANPSLIIKNILANFIATDGVLLWNLYINSIPLSEVCEESRHQYENALAFLKIEEVKCEESKKSLAKSMTPKINLPKFLGELITVHKKNIFTKN